MDSAIDSCSSRQLPPQKSVTGNKSAQLPTKPPSYRLGKVGNWKRRKCINNKYLLLLLSNYRLFRPPTHARVSGRAYAREGAVGGRLGTSWPDPLQRGVRERGRDWAEFGHVVRISGDPDANQACNHVGESGGATESPVGYRLPQPPDARGPLGAGRPQHGARMADHRQPRPAGLRSFRPTETKDMARSDARDEGLSRPPETGTPSQPHDVDVLGGPSAECALAVRPEATPARPQGPVTSANVLRLLDWQRYRCALTGRPLEPQTASLDHMVPVRCGGQHCIDNVQVLHRQVNRAKGTLTNEEFIQLCREVVEHVGRQEEQGGKA